MVTLGLGAGMGRAAKIGTADFSPALNSTLAWYDVGDAATVTQTSNAVSQLNDKSGNARHVANVFTRRPTYDAANKKITFDGVNDSLVNNNPFMWTAGRYAVYAVVNATAADFKCMLGEANGSSPNQGFSVLMSGSGSSNDEITPYIHNDSGAIVRGFSTTQAVYTGAKKIIRLYDNYGLVQPWINGTLAANPVSYTRAGNTLTLNRFAIGCRPEMMDAAGGGIDGEFLTAMELYELIIAPNDDYGQQYEGYLAHKHGLTADLPVSHPYKTVPPKTGQGTSYAQSLNTGAVTAALFGDSITATNTVNVTDVKTYRNNGYFTAYNALAQNRMHLPVANNKGVSGDQTSGMVSRLAADIGPLTYDVCFFMGGTNDVSQSRTFDQIRNDIDTIINYVTMTMGKKIVLLSILPRQHDTDTATRKQKILDLNAFLAASAGSREGRVSYVDLYTNFNDGTDFPVANATYDNLHPTPTGAMIMGQDIKAQLAALYGNAASPDFTTGNLAANGTLSGTGGTGAGAIATGWTLAVSGPAVTATKDSNGFQNIVTNYTANAGDNAYEFRRTVTTGFANGDTVYAAALVQALGIANIRQLELQLWLEPGAVQTYWRSYGMYESGMLISETHLSPGQYLIVTPRIPLASGSITGLRILLRHQVNANSLLTTSNVTIKAMGIFKV